MSTLIQLRNIKTEKTYTIDKEKYDKMLPHHKNKFEVIGQLEPVAVKDSVKFVPSIVEQAVERMQAKEATKASPDAQA